MTDCQNKLKAQQNWPPETDRHRDKHTCNINTSHPPWPNMIGKYNVGKRKYG